MSPSSTQDDAVFSPGVFKFYKFSNTYLPSPTKQLAQSADLQVPFPDFSRPFSGFSHFFSFKGGTDLPSFGRWNGSAFLLLYSGQPEFTK